MLAFGIVCALVSVGIVVVLLVGWLCRCEDEGEVWVERPFPT